MVLVRYVSATCHGNTRFFHRVSLRDRARETVQQENRYGSLLGVAL